MEGGGYYMFLSLYQTVTKNKISLICILVVVATQKKKRQSTLFSFRIATIPERKKNGISHLVFSHRLMRLNKQTIVSQILVQVKKIKVVWGAFKTCINKKGWVCGPQNLQHFTLKMSTIRWSQIWQRSY